MPVADVNKTRLNYRLDGPEQGSVVMLSNSLASNLSMWDAQVPVLIKAGYRALRYDSRGHGQFAVSRGPYSMEILAADAVGLMDVLRLETVHFCGLSMGGMVGQMLGVHHGDRLLSLTLCDTASYTDDKKMWDERIKTVRENGMKAVVDDTIDRWFTRAGQERLPTEVEKIRQMILGTSIDGFCACCYAIRDMDQRDSIRTISTRTLVMVGEEDLGTPLSTAEFIHHRITSSELKVIPHAAHLINVEQAHIFNRALLEFIRKSGAV